MGLSSDPEKRAAQLENLRRGREKHDHTVAAKLAGQLDIEDYDPPPAGKKKTTAKPPAKQSAPAKKRTRTADPPAGVDVDVDAGVSLSGLLIGVAAVGLLMIVLGRAPRPEQQP